MRSGAFAPPSRRTKSPVEGAGDIWTWTAMDADSKMILSWTVGSRDAESASVLMDDLSARLAHRVQLTTDGHAAYLTAVDEAFGTQIDYAMLVKLYGESPDSFKGRYSPSQFVGSRTTAIMG